jgi:hypothetical protein
MALKERNEWINEKKAVSSQLRNHSSRNSISTTITLLRGLGVFDVRS